MTGTASRDAGLGPRATMEINEGGCGDAFLAAIIAGIVKGLTIEETLKSAGAVAGAAAESEITAGFDPPRADKLINDVVVTKLAGKSTK